MDCLALFASCLACAVVSTNWTVVGLIWKQLVTCKKTYKRSIQKHPVTSERKVNQSKAGRTKEKNPEASSACLREKLFSPKLEELKRSIQKDPGACLREKLISSKLEELKRRIQKHPVLVTLLTLISCHFYQPPSREAWYFYCLRKAHNTQSFWGIRNNKHYIKDN